MSDENTIQNEKRLELIRNLRSVRENCEKIIDQSYSTRPIVVWDPDLSLIKIGEHTHGLFTLLPAQLHFPNGNVREEYDIALKIHDGNWVGTGYSSRTDYSISTMRWWAESICPKICEGDWDYLQDLSEPDNSKRLYFIKDLLAEKINKLTQIS
tara:strand:- start:2833 stop:3294 length:462 start_codon:yes stop_codon:yes gene_type:complete